MSEASIQATGDSMESGSHSADKLTVGVTVFVGVLVAVCDGVTVLVGVFVGVLVAVCDGVTVFVGVFVGVGEGQG